MTGYDRLNSHRWVRWHDPGADIEGFCRACGLLLTGKDIALMRGPDGFGGQLQSFPVCTAQLHPAAAATPMESGEAGEGPP